MRKFTETELVVATHNAGKMKEIRDLLHPYIPTFYSAADVDVPEPEETEKSFEGNALLKARAAARQSGKPSLADDSGLSVTALGGAPGIYSARWAYPDGSTVRDFDYAMARVNAALAGHDDRSAAFVCALALAWPDGGECVFTGRVNGVIIPAPRGDKGFGYDPIFVPDGYDVTFAEMESAEKHRISHRANAFAQMVAEVFTA